MKEKNMLELLPDNPYIQYGFAILYTSMLVFLLVWAIKKGSQVANVTPEEYITKSTDEVFLKGLHEKTRSFWVIPAKAGIQRGLRFRNKFGMTVIQ